MTEKMTKSKFVSQTATGGLLQDDRDLLTKYFDDEGHMKDGFAEACLMQLQMQTISKINGLNKLISESIRELGFIGQWTNLIQIFRSLPDCVADAVQRDRFKEEMQEWAKVMNDFIGLASAQQKRAIELVKEEEKANVQLTKT
jgi:hypothetical protein